jgi:hypothetical protein
MQLYATYMQLMQLYATILQLYATILQQFHMQLYAKYATICNYATMQLCNMQLMQLKQLYGTYATLRNFMQHATLCNNATYATMQLYATYATMQLYATYATICNYMMDKCGNFNFMQLNATICNCVGTKNVYWHDNLSSCFNECRYHQIGICRIYLPRVMIKIY